MEEIYIKLEDAAPRLGLTYNTLKKYVFQGIVPKEETKKVGKYRKISESYIKDMEGREVLNLKNPRG